MHLIRCNAITLTSVQQENGEARKCQIIYAAALRLFFKAIFSQRGGTARKCDGLFSACIILKWLRWTWLLHYFQATTHWSTHRPAVYPVFHCGETGDDTCEHFRKCHFPGVSLNSLPECEYRSVCVNQLYLPRQNWVTHTALTCKLASGCWPSFHSAGLSPISPSFFIFVLALSVAPIKYLAVLLGWLIPLWIGFTVGNLILFKGPKLTSYC